jgi:hypothetical protein
MIRNLKALGLALVAVAAFAAFASAAASAAEFHSEGKSTLLTGAQESTNTFTANAGTTHCATATFEGTSSSTGTTQTNQNVKPTYSSCKLTAFGGESLNATVDTGCEYNLSANGPVTLECGASSMRVTAPFCTITVNGQTVNKAEYSNVGTGTTREILVTSKVTGLKYTQSAFCPTGGGTFENGTYNGTVKVTGEAGAGGSHVGVWWE